MAIDLSGVTSAITSAGVAAASVGVAVLLVRWAMKTFKHVGDAVGGSLPPRFRGGQQIGSDQHGNKIHFYEKRG